MEVFDSLRDSRLGEIIAFYARRLVRVGSYFIDAGRHTRPFAQSRLFTTFFVALAATVFQRPWRDGWTMSDFVTPVIAGIILVLGLVFLWNLILAPLRDEVRQEREKVRAERDAYKREFALKKDVSDLRAKMRKLEGKLQQERERRDS